MSSSVLSIETGHADVVHDAQPDYYGKRLATCSSDRTVRIYDVDGDAHVLSAELRWHEGPVWEVAWAHPKFGSLLASASYDRQVIVSQETAPGKWAPVYFHRSHESSVNAVAWAPHEFGLTFASASSDGTVRVVSYKGDAWVEEATLRDCPAGVNALTWAPFSHIGSQVGARPIRRLATAGCDNKVRVWSDAEGPDKWSAEGTAFVGAEHTMWVRDVAWAPSSGMPCNLLASCSDDGQVILWRQGAAGAAWEGTALPAFGVPVWRVSWSLTGNLLAVSAGDNQVTLWKQSMSGRWEKVSAVDPTSEAPAVTVEAPASGGGAGGGAGGL